MSIEEMYRKWYGPIEDSRSSWCPNEFEENSITNSDKRKNTSTSDDVFISFYFFN
jgi:hypothetical protein